MARKKKTAQSPATKPVKQPDRQVARGLPLKRTALAAVLLSVAFVTVAMIGNARYRSSVRSRIPPVPDLPGKTVFFRQAISQADAAARTGAPSDQNIGQLGLLYHANHLYGQADNCYALAMEVNARSSRWPYCLAVLRETTGVSRGVEDLLRKTLDLDPAHGPARLHLGDNLLKQGRFDEAAEQYQRYLKSAPRDPYALLGLARVAESRGNWPVAKDCLEQAVAADRSFGPAHRLLATIHEKLGDPQRAEASAARAAACSRFQPSPDPLSDQLDEFCYDPVYLLVRADHARQVFNVARGLSLLRRAIEVAPDNAQAHVALANAMRELGQPAVARPHLLKAIELEPANAEARVEMALLLGAEGDLGGAEQSLNEAMQHHPEDASIRHALGNICMQRNRREEAAAHFLRAAELSEWRFDDAIDGYVTCLMQMGDAAKAEAFLRKVLSLRPTATRPRTLLARVYVSRQAWSEAATVLREGLSAGPFSATLANALAGLLNGLPSATDEQIREAVRLAERAVDFCGPADLPGQLDTLGVACARAGDFDRAIKAEEQALQSAQQMNRRDQLDQLNSHLAAFKARTPVVISLNSGSPASRAAAGPNP